MYHRKSLRSGHPFRPIHFRRKPKGPAGHPGDKPDHQHILFLKPVGGHKAKFCRRKSQFLADLPGGRLLGGLSRLHISGDQIGVPIRNILLPQQSHLPGPVCDQGDHAGGKRIKPGHFTGSAPGHFPVVPESPKGELRPTLRAILISHDALTSFP